jgi:hypothetical protein
MAGLSLGRTRGILARAPADVACGIPTNTTTATTSILTRNRGVRQWSGMALTPPDRLEPVAVTQGGAERRNGALVRKEAKFAGELRGPGHGRA